VSQFNWRKLDIRIYAVCASLMISLFTILIPDTLNDDAYVYIRTADIALDEGITAAFQHYSWATYSLLIAAVSTLGLDLFSAAFVINGLFYALLIYAFVSIISEVDSSRLTLTFAAICVLVYPQLNEYRYLIIRDIGFWALTLFSVWLFIRNAKTRQFKYAFGYCCALILAASFRAEAAAFLFLVPFTTLLNRQKSREENLNIFVRLMATIIGSSIAAMLMLSVLGFDNLAFLLSSFLYTSPLFLMLLALANLKCLPSARLFLGNMLQHILQNISVFSWPLVCSQYFSQIFSMLLVGLISSFLFMGQFPRK
jgi:hypothetical protein